MGSRQRTFRVINRVSDDEDVFSDDDHKVFSPWRSRPTIRGPRSQHDLSSPSSTSSPAVEEPPPPPTPAIEIPERPTPGNPLPPRPSDSPDRVLILVTSDSERYVNVDITDAQSPGVIRECVFSKLNIFDDEDQARFSIYRTEIGAYALGDALSDEKLLELCRMCGDSKGSLKLLVSHSSAPVHETAVRPLPTFNPVVNTIPPPVLPQPQPYPPLRPRRRPSSRNEGSISSASEHVELAAGYEADLDSSERDSNRNTIRPSLQQVSIIVPPSPLATRRPAPLPSRPSSPPPSVVPLPQPPNTNTFIDMYGNSLPAPPPPPPLSPNRSSFFHEDNNMTPRTHIRSGSDAAADRDKYHHDLPKTLRPQQSQQTIPTPNRMIPEPSQSRDRPFRTRTNREYDDTKMESWVVVSKNDNSRPDQDSLPTPPESSRQARAQRQHVSPTRYTKATSPYTGKPLRIPDVPRHPPPVPNSSNTEPRSLAPRTANQPGQPVPAKWPITWKGEQKSVESKPLPSSNNFRMGLGKGAKSMDNLRVAYSNHPSTLQPGGDRTRRNQNLPFSPPNGNLAYGSNSTTAINRPFRPLPNHIQSLSPDSTSPYMRTPPLSLNHTSPNQEPYPRPQSALGDAALSPTQRTNHQRQYQPPTHVLDSADSSRSPGSLLSPSNIYIPNGITGSRSGSDSYIDIPLGSRSSSPRSPNSTRNPSNSRDKTNDFDGTVESNGERKRNSDATLKKEDHTWLASILDRPSESTLVSSSRKLDDTLLSISLPTVDISPLVSDGTFRSFKSLSSTDSDDEIGTSLWNRPPAAGSKSTATQRPPLTVQIETNGVHPASTLSSQLSQQSSRGPSTTPTPMQHQKSASTSSPPSTSRATKKTRSRASGFGGEDDEDSSSWAPRPPPEDMYDKLEVYFPGHDLDKPVVEAGSGSTSPTTVDQSPALLVSQAPDRSRIKGKKSIRIVAEEQKKRIDRTSRAESLQNVMRKRSTKLWGSKIEEVVPGQSYKEKEKEKIPVPTHPESPSGSSKASFTWVKGGLIGKGTYGRVYLALNMTNGEMIAVKQVEIPRTPSDKNDSRQATVVHALKKEIEMLKDLDHPNIVQYLGFEETPDNLSIFLEYVPGGSIGSVLLKHGKFSEDVTKSFTGQILGGLEYLHSRGILHRDLKADNILVEMTGTCKISDFGISKRTAETNGGAATALQGTVFWMAPEVVNPTPTKGYNFKADIWSVGCVVLEMWAGMRPWMGDEIVAVMFKLYHSKLLPPVPAEVVLSELADDFRMKCFAINPEERPSAAELRKHPYLELPPGWEFNGFT